MEESNKSLALLLVAAIVVSLGGTIVSLNKLGDLQLSSTTGRVITNGTATIDITATAVLNITDNSIDFGAGSLSTGFDNCTLSSNVTDSMSPSGCGTWTWTKDYFVLENVGSGAINVTIQSNKNASEFIGGTTPSFKYSCADADGEGGSETYYASGAWTEFDETTQDCIYNLESASGNDESWIYAQVRVGLTATGSKTSTITFVASLSS